MGGQKAGVVGKIRWIARKLHLPHIPYFLIFYSSTFTFLLIILAALLLIPLADAIQQCVENKAFFNIFIISGVYLLTGVASLFVYGSRLYTLRTHLAAIPKSYIPVEKGDLPRRVRAVVLRNLARSATIAYDAKPRDLSAEDQPDANAAWNRIQHPGYSRPAARPTPGQLPPNTRFGAVLDELPHLIEARAVSLLPQPPSDEALRAFRRCSTAGLRRYLLQLGKLGLMDGQATSRFLRLYEGARFSGQPISQPKFGELMEAFAGVLRGMSERSEAVFEALDLDTGSETSKDDSLPGEDGSLGSRDEEGSIDSERRSSYELQNFSTGSSGSINSECTIRIGSQRRKVHQSGPSRDAARLQGLRPTPPIRKGSEISMTGEGSTIRLRRQGDPESEDGVPYSFVQES